MVHALSKIQLFFSTSFQRKTGQLIFSMVGCPGNRRLARWSLACHKRHFPAFPCVQLKVLDLAYPTSAHLGPFIRKQASNQVLLGSQHTHTAWLPSSRHPIT
jgi:hypothetical protein